MHAPSSLRLHACTCVCVFVCVFGTRVPGTMFDTRRTEEYDPTKAVDRFLNLPEAGWKRHAHAHTDAHAYTGTHTRTCASTLGMGLAQAVVAPRAGRSRELRIRDVARRALALRRTYHVSSNPYTCP